MTQGSNRSLVRCVLLSEMLQPYRIPVFNALAQREDLDFQVLLLSIKEANREWEVDLDRVQFKYELLPHLDLYIRALDYGLHLNRGLSEALKKANPEVIVGTGYTSPTYWRAQQFIHRRQGGYVLWSGSTEKSSRVGAPPVQWAKKRFVSRCDAFLSYGSAAKRMLVGLGADPGRVVQGTNTVDVDLFARLPEEARQDPGYREWRNRYPQRLVLFVGQMIDRKGVPELVEAFRQTARPDLGLILVGEGPMLDSYRRRFAEVPNLFWEGYRQTREMGPYYAAADALAMPSSIEVWGLVVNEALAAGVPVIATSCSGATEDLIEEGVNGHVYESGDMSKLSQLLASIAADPDSWTAMGQRGAQKMQALGPDCYAAAFAQAVHLAAPRRRRASN